MNTASEPAGPIVLFDGVCNLCDSAVLFIIDHDPEKRFRFAALQCEAAESLLLHYGYRGEKLGSMILLEGGQLYTGSTAALRIARGLCAPWPFLYGFVVVPRRTRDTVYRWIARNRYRWFGRREQCRVPSPELRSRFLDSADAPPVLPLRQ